MIRYFAIAIVTLLCAFSTEVFAAIDQVRVINATNQPVSIHVGGYPQGQLLAPGQWKVFTYPFKVVPPGANTPIQTGLLIATAGGHWETTPDGVSEFKKPVLLLCIDYNSQDLVNKTGNRKWTIKSLGGFDKGCQLKSYKQPWYQAS